MIPNLQGGKDCGCEAPTSLALVAVGKKLYACRSEPSKKIKNREGREDVLKQPRGVLARFAYNVTEKGERKGKNKLIFIFFPRSHSREERPGAGGEHCGGQRELEEDCFSGFESSALLQTQCMILNKSLSPSELHRLLPSG